MKDEASPPRQLRIETRGGFLCIDFVAGMVKSEEKNQRQTNHMQPDRCGDNSNDLQTSPTYAPELLDFSTSIDISEEIVPEGETDYQQLEIPRLVGQDKSCCGDE